MVFVAAGMNLALLATGFSLLALADGREPGGFEQMVIKLSIWLMVGSLVGLILRWFTHPNDRHAGRVNLDPPGPPSDPPKKIAPRRRPPALWAVVGLLALATLRRR